MGCVKHDNHTLYKGKKVVPKDLPSLKIHASSLRNSLAAEELAGGPRARARCVIHISRHGATRSLKPATGARQPLPSMIHARARACSDDGCLRLTARTRKRGSTHIGQWQSHAHGRHGLSSCARPMHVPHDAQPLNLPVRAQNSQVGHRGAATLPNVGDMRSTSVSCTRGGGLKCLAWPVGCAGPAQLSNLGICALLRIHCWSLRTHVRTLETSLPRADLAL